MTTASKILWDTVPTLKRAQSASVTAGARIRRGLKRTCCHGGGLMSDAECRRRFAERDELCTRGGLCSVGMVLAKGEAA